MMKKQLHQQIMNKKQAYKALKLEAIEEAPLGLVICYDRSVLNNFTIGTVGIMKQSSLVRSVQHKIFGFLTEQGYSMGWVSILNYYQFKQLVYQIIWSRWVFFVWENQLPIMIINPCCNN
jgi:hypothetical protein